MKIYTAQEVAVLVNTSEKRIRVMATKRGVGQKIGKLGMWAFSKNDIGKLKPGPMGGTLRKKPAPDNQSK